MSADFQAAMAGLSSSITIEAFKEESIRMYQIGFNTKDDLSINTNQSPGYNYILQDGF